MAQKPIILEYYDNVNSVCSFWRGRGVLSELERQGLIQLTLSNWNESWPEIRRHNIAFFQRPMTKNCLQQVMVCKDLGLKIWIDLDDWKEPPLEHHMYKEYQEAFDDKYFKAELKLADLITVTNTTLRDSYIEYLPEIKSKIRIIPNAINNYVYPFKPMSTNKWIVYRGGENHDYDIKPYISDIKKVLDEHKDWKLLSIGYELHELYDCNNYQYLGDFSIHQYFGLLLNLNPAIMIVPLVDNKFNRCKSNISYLEGTIAGAACLCPEYFDGDYYEYNKDFYTGLDYLITNKSLRVNIYNSSIDDVKENYLLSNVNKLRLELINQLL